MTNAISENTVDQIPGVEWVPSQVKVNVDGSDWWDRWMPSSSDSTANSSSSDTYSSTNDALYAPNELKGLTYTTFDLDDSLTISNKRLTSAPVVYENAVRAILLLEGAGEDDVDTSLIKSVEYELPEMLSLLLQSIQSLSDAATQLNDDNVLELIREPNNSITFFSSIVHDPITNNLTMSSFEREVSLEEAIATFSNSGDEILSLLRNGWDSEVVNYHPATMQFLNLCVGSPVSDIVNILNATISTVSSTITRASWIVVACGLGAAICVLVFSTLTIRLVRSRVKEFDRRDGKSTLIHTADLLSHRDCKLFLRAVRDMDVNIGSFDPQQAAKERRHRKEKEKNRRRRRDAALYQLGDAEECFGNVSAADNPNLITSPKELSSEDEEEMEAVGNFARAPPTTVQALRRGRRGAFIAPVGLINPEDAVLSASPLSSIHQQMQTNGNANQSYFDLASPPNAVRQHSPSFVLPSASRGDSQYAPSVNVLMETRQKLLNLQQQQHQINVAYQESNAVPLPSSGFDSGQSALVFSPPVSPVGLYLGPNENELGNTTQRNSPVALPNIVGSMKGTRAAAAAALATEFASTIAAQSAPPLEPSKYTTGLLSEDTLLSPTSNGPEGMNLTEDQKFAFHLNGGVHSAYVDLLSNHDRKSGRGIAALMKAMKDGKFPPLIPDSVRHNDGQQQFDSTFVYHSEVDEFPIQVSSSSPSPVLVVGTGVVECLGTRRGVGIIPKQIQNASMTDAHFKTRICLPEDEEELLLVSDDQHVVDEDEILFRPIIKDAFETMTSPSTKKQQWVKDFDDLTKEEENKMDGFDNLNSVGWVRKTLKMGDLAGVKSMRQSTVLQTRNSDEYFRSRVGSFSPVRIVVLPSQSEFGDLENDSDQKEEKRNPASTDAQDDDRTSQHTEYLDVKEPLLMPTKIETSIANVDAAEELLRLVSAGDSESSKSYQTGLHQHEPFYLHGNDIPPVFDSVSASRSESAEVVLPTTPSAAANGRKPAIKTGRSSLKQLNASFSDVPGNFYKRSSIYSSRSQSSSSSSPSVRSSNNPLEAPHQDTFLNSVSDSEDLGGDLMALVAKKESQRSQIKINRQMFNLSSGSDVIKTTSQKDDLNPVFSRNFLRKNSYNASQKSVKLLGDTSRSAVVLGSNVAVHEYTLPSTSMFDDDATVNSPPQATGAQNLFSNVNNQSRKNAVSSLERSTSFPPNDQPTTPSAVPTAFEAFEAAGTQTKTANSATHNQKKIFCVQKKNISGPFPESSEKDDLNLKVVGEFLTLTSNTDDEGENHQKLKTVEEFQPEKSKKQKKKTKNALHDEDQPEEDEEEEKEEEEANIKSGEDFNFEYNEKKSCPEKFKYVCSCRFIKYVFVSFYHLLLGRLLLVFLVMWTFLMVFVIVALVVGVASVRSFLDSQDSLVNLSRTLFEIGQTAIRAPEAAAAVFLDIHKASANAASVIVENDMSWRKENLYEAKSRFIDAVQSAEDLFKYVVEREVGSSGVTVGRAYPSRTTLLFENTCLSADSAYMEIDAKSFIQRENLNQDSEKLQRTRAQVMGNGTGLTWQLPESLTPSFKDTVMNSDTGGDSVVSCGGRWVYYGDTASLERGLWRATLRIFERAKRIYNGDLANESMIITDPVDNQQRLLLLTIGKKSDAWWIVQAVRYDISPGLSRLRLTFLDEASQLLSQRIQLQWLVLCFGGILALFFIIMVEFWLCRREAADLQRTVVWMRMMPAALFVKRKLLEKGLGVGIEEEEEDESKFNPESTDELIADTDENENVAGKI
eukprot:GDKJ01012727.1.p1 GENE.GDKJ01012727.1~~GDKJ01012727.1.p1  ORF type:complete len:1999 (-),score=465.81 GDKJ01012727.1:641-5941(-)